MDELLHPSDSEPLTQALKNHFEKGEHYCLEIRMKCKDGVFRWYETHGHAKFSEDHKPVRMVGSITDIQNRKELEQRDKEIIRVLSSQNKRLENFAHIVSHNLRSHTGNLKALMDLLPNIDDEVETEQILSYVADNCNQLHDTVQQLNEVVKIQTNILGHKEELEFEVVFNRIRSGLSHVISEKGALIEADFSEARTIVYLPAYLDSVFMNLITNALKYSSPDRPPHIRIKSETQGSFTFLSVEDNGLGIDLESAGNRLFGLRKTFHDNPDARGVGLFLIKNQVEAMEGRISVVSEVNRGSTFTVKFKQ